MAKSTIKSTKPFVKGGTTKMFTEREAGPQKPGVSSNEGGDAPETQFASGGKTKMFGKQTSNPSKAC